MKKRWIGLVGAAALVCAAGEAGAAIAYSQTVTISQKLAPSSYVPVLHIHLYATNPATPVTSMTFTLTGTAVDVPGTEIESISLYEEGATTVGTYEGTEAKLGNTVNNPSYGTVTFDGFSRTYGNKASADYLVVVKTTSAATVGHTLGVQLTGANVGTPLPTPASAFVTTFWGLTVSAGSSPVRQTPPWGSVPRFRCSSSNSRRPERTCRSRR